MPDLLNGLGGPAGFGENFVLRTDDDSSEFIDISSVFGNGLGFFGATYRGFYINTNGSVTFDGPFEEFTPSPISSGTPAGIFPFWADVDTQAGETTASPGGTSQGTNLVYYDLDPIAGAVTVTWDDVGYFNGGVDKRNAFQLVLTDVSDEAGRSDGDFLISFRYEHLEWTTGDASDGIDGLGGVVARAGYSAGADERAFYELPASGDGEAMLALADGPALRFLSAGGEVTRLRNTPPSAAADAATVTEDGSVTIDVLGNDVDADGDTLTIGEFGQGEHGVVTQSAGGLTYRPNLNFNGRDQFSYAVSDGNGGTSTASVSISITAVDDAPTVGGATAGRLGEDAATVSGAISISDPDAGQNPTFAGRTATGAFGSIAVNAAGALWTYTLNNAAVQFLAAGQTRTDALRLTASDGTTRDIVVTIDGADDPAIPSGATAGRLGEDAAAVSGAISISDPDAGQNPSFAGRTAAGAFGTIAVDAAGTLWTYTLNRAAVQFLNDGDTRTDALRLTASDGTTRDIVVTIDGADDPAVPSGATAGRLGEDAAAVSGAISISDPDAGQNPTFAGRTAAGAFGSIAVNAAGTLWTYTLNNAAVQFLAAGQTRTDALRLTASDGTTRDIVVTIDGADDPAVPSGATAGRLGEDAATVSGAISISDPDAGQNPTFAGRTATGAFGSIAVNAAGTQWTYTLNGGAVQFLNDGDTRTDALRLTASDGAILDVVVTIDGADEEPPGGNVATEGPDRLTGTPQADAIDALGGNDTVKGLADDDVLILGTGDDIALGGSGDDTITGDAGDDTIKSGAGADSIDGGAGNDVILSGNDDDTILGGAGDDTIKPGRGNDSMDGGAGDDILVGFRGDEMLIGGDGNDTLLGNLDDDTIVGGAGDDRLQGGPGRDVFVFDEASWGDDRIVLDFLPQSDTLDFRGSGLTLADLTIASAPGGNVLIEAGDSSILINSTRFGPLDVNDFVGDVLLFG